MFAQALDIWLWLVAGLYLLGALLTLRGHARVPTLPMSGDGVDGDPPADMPSVAVVVAARDEAARIADTVKALAAQRGAPMRAVVVDDRSTDGTGEIAQRAIVETRAERIEAARIDALPEGWLGKCHALHVGARQALREAPADWLLFMDADCALAPDAIASALRAARRDRADHVCLIPQLESRSTLGRAGLLAFLIPLIRRCGAANVDHPRGWMGIGAFNLVKRSMYESFGGHEALRMEVLDDIFLGALVKRAGGATRIYFAPRAVSVDYASTIPDLFRVVRKNAFAALRYSAPLAAGLLALLTAVWVSGALGFLTRTPAGFAATGAFLSTIIPAIVGARRFGWPIAPALLTPFVVIIVPASFAASIATILRDGGVRWRDTFYPLETLRAGMTPPAAAKK